MFFNCLLNWWRSPSLIEEVDLFEKESFGDFHGACDDDNERIDRSILLEQEIENLEEENLLLRNATTKRIIKIREQREQMASLNTLHLEQREKLIQARKDINFRNKRISRLEAEVKGLRETRDKHMHHGHYANKRRQKKKSNRKSNK